MKQLWMFGLLCLCATQGFSLDREAFTFTSYHLDVRIEPEQQRIGVRGKIALRNDSNIPQNHLSLQISSTLHWISIQTGSGQPLQFLTQSYTSDTDHTGSLSEAIVTLAQEIPPNQSIELDIGYEGTISLDTKRLERIGVSKETAKQSDWDEIGRSFTGVRGVGYVAWYPVAMEAASMSDGNSVLETVDRWKQRHADCSMEITINSTSPDPVLFSGTPSGLVAGHDKDVANIGVFHVLHFGMNVPTLVIADYQKASAGIFSVSYLPGDEAAAKAYVDTLGKLDPLASLGMRLHGLEVSQLPDSGGSPFLTEGVLLLPLTLPVTPETELTLIYALAREEIRSPRVWIQEGLAHYAQALYIEEQHGRHAALDYLNAHRAVLLDAEKSSAQKLPASSSNDGQISHSLINAPDDIYLQTKAMNVWWMLRDMLGLNLALSGYRGSEDKDTAYLQRLLEKQTHKDLEWFFDDWVYRDHGLPDFRVTSAYPRKLIGGQYMVTITVENLGGAGAEVPIIMKMETGEIRKRIEVRAKSKASIRIESSSTPQEIIVNDGSVPESDVSNNVYKIAIPATAN